MSIIFKGKCRNCSAEAKLDLPDTMRTEKNYRRGVCRECGCWVRLTKESDEKEQ